MINTKGFPTKMENEPRPCTLVTLLHRAVDCSQRDKARDESGANCYIQQENMRKKKPYTGRKMDIDQVLFLHASSKHVNTDIKIYHL